MKSVYNRAHQLSICVTLSTLDCWNKGLVLQVACEKSYVCPSCFHMKRRVAVEDVQQLVSSWRQLGFHLTEGKALEYLAAEVSRWQRMARLVLSTDEVTSALKLLGFPVSNSRIWRRESVGEKSVNDAGLQSDRLSKTFGDASRTDYSEGVPYPIDLSLSSARKGKVSDFKHNNFKLDYIVAVFAMGELNEMKSYKKVESTQLCFVLTDLITANS